jgi:hypothetical protein
MTSFMPMGMTSMGPNTWPLARHSSDARPWRSAFSSSSDRNAYTLASMVLIYGFDF